MDTYCNSKTLHGSTTIIICIFKQTGYDMSHAMKSGILHQLDSRVLKSAIGQGWLPWRPGSKSFKIIFIFLLTTANKWTKWIL